jgi:hypothetical protein
MFSLLRIVLYLPLLIRDTCESEMFVLAKRSPISNHSRADRLMSSIDYHFDYIVDMFEKKRASTCKLHIIGMGLFAAMEWKLVASFLALKLALLQLLAAQGSRFLSSTRAIRQSCKPY